VPNILTQLRAPFEIKAAEESEGKRIVRGLASTWNLDLGNDVIHKGAFSRTLAHWKSAKREKPIPFVDQHRYDSVTRIIGKMTEAAETSDGLEVAFEMATHQHALDVFSLIQSGMVTGLSIGYEAIKFEFEKEDNKPAWELTRHISELKLFEISAVIWPMNDEARIDLATVKSLLEEAKLRELTPDELRELSSLATDITALLQKCAPAPVKPPPVEPQKDGLATPEQIAQLNLAVAMLKLRSPATRDSDPARSVLTNPRTEESHHVTAGTEEGRA
jgi:HK97 family phage prohead protease